MRLRRSAERRARHVAATATIFDARRASRKTIDQSGVWRFREAVLDVDEDEIVTHPEGSTRLYERDGILFKHEGENPTGSFKDRGMTVAMTQAKRLGARAVACASTGNTSASLAAYAAQAGLRAHRLRPRAAKSPAGKLAQTLAYGATVLQVRGDFDAAMRLVREACDRLGIYLVNSINPFRIEGQKTIVWELLQDLEWNAPDWIVVPAGNLGNTSAFGKALREALDAGWIDDDAAARVDPGQRRESVLPQLSRSVRARAIASPPRRSPARSASAIRSATTKRSPRSATRTASSTR